MRPIERGAWPEQDAVCGVKREFKKYDQARGEMITRLGEYCSFCEMHLDAGLAIEHVQPKKPLGATKVDQERLLDWHNFLLACPNCNSTKSNEDVFLVNFLWPDQDNTFRALSYSEGGIVGLASTLDGLEKFRAEETLRLTGLSKQPENDPCVSDRRWLNRMEAWNLACWYKQKISTSAAPDDMHEAAIKHARDKGFWSVWMTVFADDPVFRKSLIDAFQGTSLQCFDVNCNAIL